MGERQNLKDLDSGTVANVGIILLVAVLAIKELESIIQPLIIAILLFLLIRPAAQWIEDRPIMQKYAHPLMPYGVLVVICLLCYGLLRSCSTLTLQHSRKKYHP